MLDLDFETYHVPVNIMRDEKHGSCNHVRRDKPISNLIVKRLASDCDFSLINYHYSAVNDVMNTRFGPFWQVIFLHYSNKGTQKTRTED